MARQPRPAARTRRAKRVPAVVFEAITLEGGLIAPAMLTQVARIEAEEQAAVDYGIARGLLLRDEIARAYRIAQALYADLTAHPEPSLAATQRFAETLLRDVLEFQDVAAIGQRTKEDEVYPISLEALGGRVPIVVVPPADGIDRVSSSLVAAGRRGSAASVVQDWLNANDGALWGIACCGTRLRLLRDNPSLTRPAYIEADLDAIFTNEGRVDFAVLWLLLHATRFGKPADPVADCTLERWRMAGLKEGEVARDRLRDGVEEALLALGTGFLSHPDNQQLRQDIEAGTLSAQAYFEQCLHLVYRLIFLFVSEDRDLLHPKQTAVIKRQRYAQGYGVGVLRATSTRRSAYDAYGDRWEALLITFASLAEGRDELGLPPLAGLFVSQRMDDLERSALGNRDLLRAIHRLAWLKTDDGVMPVNWRDMQTEEFGSVYESLLELTPRISPDGRAILFAEGLETRGNARKTTGSYYTPDSLVQALLDTVIEPVMDQAVAGAAEPVRALLGLRIIDPACGSGHFLLAAARRLAGRVARARNDGVASAEHYREAVRDVVRQCVYGVDRNPMAVDLTKVALWIESIEPGKPLGFLDGNIVCGDALLGTFDSGTTLDALLDAGIPEEAYRPLTGDDRDACRRFVLAERDDRSGAANLFDPKAWKPTEEHAAKLIDTFRAMSEDTPGQVMERRDIWIRAMTDPGLVAKRQAADLYLGAFLSTKGVADDPYAKTLVPRTIDVTKALHRGQIDQSMLESCRERILAARVFHWGLTFSDIFERGGFDVVIGNPPWERIKLQEQEFFASLDPEVAEAANASERAKLIEKLKNAGPGTRQRAIYDSFVVTKRSAEALSVFTRLPAAALGRFPLTGRGDVNTYSLFSELFRKLTSNTGRAGVIVPTGIATDSTTAPFFADLVSTKSLVKIIDFENRERLFPAVDSRMKFCILCMAKTQHEADYAFFLTNTHQISDSERTFKLSATEINIINPNTKVAPLFRSKADARVAAGMYERTPVLRIDDGSRGSDPWSFRYMTKMFDMADSSSSFKTVNQLSQMNLKRDGNFWSSLDGNVRFVPLYEAKMVSSFDHRAASYEERGEGRGYRVLPETSLPQHQDINYEPAPFYWINESEFEARLANRSWKHHWLLGWKDVAAVTNERTVDAIMIPRLAVGHTIRVMFADGGGVSPAFLAANLNSIFLDYIARLKFGGLHLTVDTLKQLPIIPPSSYATCDSQFLISRIIELTYTSCSMAEFASELGYDGPPFVWNIDRRAVLRSEIDAFYALAYGLSRDEVRFILDPAEAMGPNYPSETFRVLKKNDIRRYGEYRSAKLILMAYDRLTSQRASLAAAE